MSRILHIVLNGYTNDNRVRRAAECARDMGFEVGVFALSAQGYPEKSSEHGIQIRRFALATRSWPKRKVVQLLKYVEAAMRMFIAGIAFRPHTVHAHDVDALVIGWFIATATRAKLIYDAHELWADPAHVETMPLWMAKGLVLVERLLARRADACITVSESISHHMATNLAISPPFVIRNVPEPWPDTPIRRLRSNLDISAEKAVVLYQGSIGGDGVMVLAQAFRKVKGDAVLVFLGDGPMAPHIRACLADLGSRVAFHPYASPEELAYFTSDADIGVHPMTAGYLNHLWALPNKLFEYIQGGLAVVASELPEMANVIRLHGIGLTFPPGDVDALAGCLQTLIDDVTLRNRFREAARSAAKSLNWRIERQYLQTIYRTVGKDA